MIVEWILDALETAVLWVAGLFPTDESEVWTYVNAIAENLGALNYFLPIAETVAIVVAVFALFPVFLGVTLAVWVVAMLRGGSARA